MIKQAVEKTVRTEIVQAGRRSDAGRKVSLAHQIAEDLKRQMDNGALKPGDRLPLCDEMCSRYGVSTITVRGALAELTAQGLIESRWRGGIFVKRVEAQAVLSAANTIALVAELATSPLSASILSGAAQCAGEAGFHVVLVATHDDPGVEAAQINELADKVFGTLVVPVNHTESHVAAFENLVARNKRLVFVDHFIQGIPAPRVTSDNACGGYLAARHLLDCGCEQIFALTAGRRTTSSEDRLFGYTQALRDSGHGVDPSRMLWSPEAHFSAGQTLTREILDALSEPGKFGIFAVNSLLAAGAYSAIKSRGLRIPEDVSVVGYDDFMAPMMDPPLTTVRQDLIEIGRRAVKLLLGLQNGKSEDFELVPVKLIVRSSSRALDPGN